MKLNKLTTITFSIILLANVSYGQGITNGLVGYWPFSGNAKDVSGNDNHGTVTGATLTTDRNGNAQAAYSFDGNGDYIELPKANVLYPDAITLNFWVLTEKSKVTMSMVSCLNSNSGEHGFIASMHSSVGWNTGGGSGSGNRYLAYHGHDFFADSQWHMLTVAYDKSIENRLALYVDGCFVGADNYSNFISSDKITYDKSYPWYIGAATQYFMSSTNNGPQYFEGALDDIRIYNRRLSDKEVHSLYGSETVYDTVKVTVYDTTYVTVYDTAYVSVTDTLFIDLDRTSGNKTITCDIQLYPNPADDVLYLESGSDCQSAGYKVKIVDMLGKTIYSSTIAPGVKSVDLDKFINAGIYYVDIRDAKDTLLARKKILIE